MTLDLVSKENTVLLVVLDDFYAKLSQWHDKIAALLKKFQLNLSRRSLDYIK